MKLIVTLRLTESYGYPLVTKELEIPIGSLHSKFEDAINDCGGEAEFKEALAMAFGQARAHQIFHVNALERRDIVSDIRQKKRDQKVHEKANEQAEEFRKERDAAKIRVCELEKDIKRWECEAQGMMRTVRTLEGKPTDLDVKGDHTECHEGVIQDIHIGTPPSPPQVEPDMGGEF